MVIQVYQNSMELDIESFIPPSYDAEKISHSFGVFVYDWVRRNLNTEVDYIYDTMRNYLIVGFTLPNEASYLAFKLASPFKIYAFNTTTYEWYR